MEGGIGNPLGARAIYIGGTLYRIHGSNEPDTIGQAVSSGCIRMTNNDVTDLYDRVQVGAKVVVHALNRLRPVLVQPVFAVTWPCNSRAIVPFPSGGE